MDQILISTTLRQLFKLNFFFRFFFVFFFCFFFSKIKSSNAIDARTSLTSARNIISRHAIPCQLLRSGLLIKYNGDHYSGSRTVYVRSSVSLTVPRASEGVRFETPACAGGNIWMYEFVSHAVSCVTAPRVRTDYTKEL